MGHQFYIISVFLHLLAACLWVGGMLFLILAFLPGVKNHPDKVALIAQVSLKFRKVGTWTLVLLLVTGIIQLEYRGVQWSWDYFMASSWGRRAGLKLLVFIVIAGISVVHDHYLGTKAIEAWQNEPDHPRTKRLRHLSRTMGRLSFLLALVAVFLGAILVRGW